MSTRFGVPAGVRISAVAAALAMGVAACSAWHGSTSAGGDLGNAPGRVVDGVAEHVPLSPMCRTVARAVVDRAARRRIAEHRPTSNIWLKREAQAVLAYEEAGCPRAAIVGLSFGAAEIARMDGLGRRSRRAEN